VPLHFYWQVGHMGLSLATMASAYMNAGLLLHGLIQRDIYQPLPGFWSDLRRIAVAAVLTLVGLWLGLDWLDGLASNDWFGRGWRLGAVVSVGLAIYFVVLLLSHPRFLRHRRL